MTRDKRSIVHKVISRTLTVVCLGVFIYAAYGLGDIFMEYYQNRQVLSDVQEQFYHAASAEDRMQNDKDNVTRGIRPGFEKLLAQNPDVVGWITIDGTQIDYPIVQSEDNVEYLTRNYYKEESIAGSIFLDYRNDVVSDLNTVVYGHRMKDGSMFKHLTKFLDKDFFDKHRTFEFDTLYDSYEAEIFAVYNTLTDFDYIKTDFASDEEYEELLAAIRKESRYETDVKVSAGDPIITLSTCDYELDENEGRLVVQAKLTKK